MVIKDYWTWFGYFSKEMNSKGCPYNGWYYYMIPVRDWIRHPIKARRLFLRQKPHISEVRIGNHTTRYSHPSDNDREAYIAETIKLAEELKL